MTDRAPAATRPEKNSNDDVKTVALVLETELDASIGTVWQALTDPAIVADWLLAGGAGAEPGSRFSLDGAAEIGGRIDCEVVESEPPRSLALLWRHEAGEGGDAAGTLVRFTLTPLEDGRTHLKLVHDGFVVRADRAVDRMAEEEMVVLLPVQAIARRRLRRPRPFALVRSGPMPTLMRLAA